MKFIDIINNYIFEVSSKSVPPYDSNSWYKIEFKNRNVISGTKVYPVYYKFTQDEYKELSDYYISDKRNVFQIYKPSTVPNNKRDIYIIEYLNKKKYVHISDDFFKKLQDIFIENDIEIEYYDIYKLPDVEDLINLIKKPTTIIDNIEENRQKLDEIIKEIKQSIIDSKKVKKTNSKVINLSTREPEEKDNKSEILNNFYDFIDTNAKKTDFSFDKLIKAHNKYRESLRKTKELKSKSKTQVGGITRLSIEEINKYKKSRDELIINLIDIIQIFTKDISEQEFIINDIIYKKIGYRHELLSNRIKQIYDEYLNSPNKKSFEEKEKKEPKKLYKITIVDKQGQKEEKELMLGNEEFEMYEPHIIDNSKKYLDYKNKVEQEFKKVDKDPTYKPKLPKFSENIEDRIVGIELIDSNKITEMSSTGGGASTSTSATANYGTGEGITSKYAFAPNKKTKINESYDLSKKYKELFKKEIKDI